MPTTTTTILPFRKNSNLHIYRDIKWLAQGCCHLISNKLVASRLKTRTDVVSLCYPWKGYPGCKIYVSCLSIPGDEILQKKYAYWEMNEWRNRTCLQFNIHNWIVWRSAEGVAVNVFDFHIPHFICWFSLLWIVNFSSHHIKSVLSIHPWMSVLLSVIATDWVCSVLLLNKVKLGARECIRHLPLFCKN